MPSPYTHAIPSMRLALRRIRLRDACEEGTRAPMDAIAKIHADMEFDSYKVGDGTGYDFAYEKELFAQGFLKAVAMMQQVRREGEGA